MLFLDSVIRRRRRYSVGQRFQAASAASWGFAISAVLMFLLAMLTLRRTPFGDSTIVWMIVSSFCMLFGVIGFKVLGEQGPSRGESWGSAMDLILGRLGRGHKREDGERVRFFVGTREISSPPSRRVQILPTCTALVDPVPDIRDFDPKAEISEMTTTSRTAPRGSKRLWRR